MVPTTVRFVVGLTVNEGQLDAFENIARTMVVGSRKEAGTLGYDFHFSADRRQCRLVETYVDANATLAHLTGPVVQDLVPKLLQTASLGTFEVYGDPGPKATEMLSGLGAKIFAFWHGLDN